MAKSPKNWSPSEEKLWDVLSELHKMLSNAGAAEARLVDDLLVEILDSETTDLDGYIGSLNEMVGWAQTAQDRLIRLKRTGK